MPKSPAFYTDLTLQNRETVPATLEFACTLEFAHLRICHLRICAADSLRSAEHDLLASSLPCHVHPTGIAASFLAVLPCHRRHQAPTLHGSAMPTALVMLEGARGMLEASNKFRLGVERRFLRSATAARRSISRAPTMFRGRQHAG